MLQKNKTHIQKLKAQLKKEFDMKDLGEGKKILGMETLKTEAQTDFDYLKRTMSQGVGEIQHDRSKTNYHSFGRHFKLSSK